MSDPLKSYGLVPRGAPVKPPLFKMPQRMVMSEADRAHGGGVTVTGKTYMENHGSYYQAKQKAEKFNTGLDEITLRWHVDAPITPVSCTEDEGGISQYVYQPRAKAVELSAPVAPQRSRESEVESRLDISVHGLSANSSDTKKLKVEDSEVKIDSKILRTVNQLFVEDEDGER